MKEEDDSLKRFPQKLGRGKGEERKEKKKSRENSASLTAEEIGSLFTVVPST